MDCFFDNLRELNTQSLIVKLLLSVLFGGLIGINRERRKRPAGIRTYMFVCMGACLASLLALYDNALIASSAALAVKTDVGRYSAQVISGIGFLGAGTVLWVKGKVRGITTAACLWSSGCMGMAIGFGFYECAIAGFVVILLTMYVLPNLQGLIRHSSEGDVK